MLLYLIELLTDVYSGFNAFSYLTMRAIMGALTALMIALFFGPLMIRRLNFHQIGQSVRDDGPESHLVKAGTPTMGGTLILVAMIVATILWADLGNRYVWVVMGVTFFFGLIGFVDDYKKLTLGNSKGLSARSKFFWQSFFALVFATTLFITARNPVETQLIVPLFKDVMLPLGALLRRADLVHYCWLQQRG